MLAEISNAAATTVFAKLVSIRVDRYAVGTNPASPSMTCSNLVAINNQLELNQPCNSSVEWILAAVNNSGNLVCDLSCNRARCAAAYQPANSICGK